MKVQFSSSILILMLAACQQQLPSRQDVGINQIPTLDPTIIRSDNGLLSSGINSVPGSYCIAGKSGKCLASNLSPAPCRAKKTVVQVAPKTNPTPSYDSLVDNKYSGTLSVPFVHATGSSEYLDEVKAIIAGTALITQRSPNAGYPGIRGLRACILKNNGPGKYGTVYWIRSANIIAVTKRQFKQVSSAEGVTATGFGLNGNTYNHTGKTEEKIWIGLEASPVNVGSVSASSGKGYQLESLPRREGLFGFYVKSNHRLTKLPAATKTSFVER